MAFVNEHISGDERKKINLNSLLENPRSNVSPASTWTIDREKNAFLLQTQISGGPPGNELPARFLFWWNGDVVYFSAYEKAVTTDRGRTVTWENAILYTPTHLKGRQTEFITVLKEALWAYGWAFLPAYCVEVHFQDQQ